MLDKFITNIVNDLDTETDHLAIREFFHTLEQSPDYEKLIKRLSYKHIRITDKRLSINLGGIKFDNPLIVAAGWDKEARAVKALFDLGFASVEVGTIPAKFQPGNPKPRDFVLAKGVRLNRYGFNTPGMEEIAKNLENYVDTNIPVGINIGLNKDTPHEESPEAHAIVAERLYKYGSYFTINVSSPNTPGLRLLQDKKPLSKIVKAVIAAMQKMEGRKPLFIKIAPDLTLEAVNDVVEVALDNELTGIVATNTTLNGDIKAKYGEKWRNEMGGVSGDDEDFRKMSTNIIRHIYKTAGKKLTVVGAGGIKDTETALEKIKAGATAIQIYTALDFQGPELPGKINEGIVKYMEKEGIKNIRELVGSEI